MVEIAVAAKELREALAELGLSRTYQSDADGMSTVSVWANLTVWCAGETYFWRVGRNFRDFEQPPREAQHVMMGVDAAHELQPCSRSGSLHGGDVMSECLSTRKHDFRVT